MAMNVGTITTLLKEVGIRCASHVVLNETIYYTARFTSYWIKGLDGIAGTPSGYIFYF